MNTICVLIGDLQISQWIRHRACRRRDPEETCGSIGSGDGARSGAHKLDRLIGTEEIRVETFSRMESDNSLGLVFIVWHNDLE